MEHIEKIKSCLINHVTEHLETMDVHEMGEIIDMIKDLEEILYYGSMIKEETK